MTIPRHQDGHATHPVHEHESLWTATVSMPHFAPLAGDVEADVCVIGGGIAGLTTAYLLTQAGKSVVLLDDGPLAGGMTGVTTAHLSNALDDRYVEIERVHGVDGARLAAASHTAAIDRIDAIVKAEHIHCDFERVDGFLFLGPDDSHNGEELLDRELAAAHRAGLVGVEKLPRVPVGATGAALGPCLRFPRQAQFHPLKYCAALAAAIERASGRIFTHTHADSIDAGPPARIKAGSFTVVSHAVVVATNSPINDLVAVHTKQAPYMSYVIGARVPRGSVARSLYWDTHDPYHYVRVQPGPESAQHDLLIVGGEDHKSGQADDTQERHARLEAWARARFPIVDGGHAIECRWAGQVMETIDGLAFIGRNPLDKENIYIVTGDSGMGMTHGTIAGILLMDLLLGRENPWTTLYDPSRKSLRAGGTYMKEAANMAAQYVDWVTGGDVASTEEIRNNSGAIVRRGLVKLAVYRDEHGTLHERSAVCPHLGCIVGWNASEKTWDCPCHGSRFDKLGRVINGPSNRDLTTPGA